jgi:outer membrane protein insertion porin family
MLSARPSLFSPLRLVLLLGALIFPARAAEVLSVQVRHDGGPIDPASVLAFTQVQAGQTFNPRACAEDVRRLQKTGRFAFVGSEVEQTQQGVVVSYIVQSKPRVGRIRIDGGEHFSNARVRELMEVQVGDLIDKPALETKLAKVREAYRKDYFPDARITYAWSPSADGRTVELEFTVEEGRRARVEDIRFTGDTPLSARKLRGVMQQKRAGLFSWITGSGALDRVQLDADRLALREALRKEGHLDAEVDEPVFLPEGRRGVVVELPLRPGPRYTVRRVAVEGVSTFPLAPVLERLQIRNGETARSDRLDRSRTGIRDFFGERGYIDAAIVQQVVPTGEPGEVDVVYRVTENRQAFIRNIEIRGNSRTQDKVIRRELTVLPGDVYDEVSVRRSAARLRNLGYFSIVNPQPRPTPEDDHYDLVLDLEEQSTGQFTAGAGFSSIDDLIGFVEISQGNFNLGGFPDNLTGGGQKIKLGLQLGTKRRDITFSFVEPWFLDRKLAFGFDLYQHDRRFLSDDYDQRNTGGALSLSRALGSFWRLRGAYSLEHIDVYDVDEAASETIRSEEGTSMESAVTVSLTRDSRNAVMVPTRGNYTRLAYKIAGGPLGFDTDYLSPQITSSQYFPLPFGHVLSLKGSVEAVEEWSSSDRVRLFDRLFMGGARTVRAFKFREVGPRDELGEPIGGQSSLYGSIEYTVPVVDKVRLATFYDYGLVDPEAYSWDTSLYNSGYGVGIRIDIPGFPLQLDYAWPDKADAFNDDSNGRFNFFIGFPSY